VCVHIKKFWAKTIMVLTGAHNKLLSRFGLVGFDVSTGGWTRARRAILTLDRFQQLTMNYEAL